jgi:hypothetical protein
MRPRLLLFLSLLAAATVAAASLPPELAEALERLNTDAPDGWSFTQTTEAENRTRIERYRAVGPEASRWQLLEVNGREPSETELDRYRKEQNLRARGEPAPNVKHQINRETAELIREEGERSVWRFQLLPAHGDAWAAHMAATFVLHRPTRTIEQVELAARESFSPRWLTNIHEARTVMRYSLPEAETPALLQEIVVRVRGRVWGFRSLDSDMVVRFSDYEKGRRR